MFCCNTSIKKSREIKDGLGSAHDGRLFSAGFTFIEMMVVLTIVGIVLFLTVPRFEDALENTRAKETESTLKSIRGAQKLFKAKNANFVGVNINASQPFKAPYWDLLQLEVLDTDDWRFGVAVNFCTCNAATATWGDNDLNIHCIPIAQKLKAPNQNQYLRIRIDNGEIVGPAVAWRDCGEPCGYYK